MRVGAMRAAELGVIVAAWVFFSGFLIVGGPLLWGSGVQGLGVIFPIWQVVLVNVVGGYVSLLFTAARAWQHQPAGLSWATATIGLVLVLAPLYSGAPAWLIWHNAILGTILALSSVVSAVEARGAITAAPHLDWAGHPVFTSLEPEMRPAPGDTEATVEHDFVNRPGKRPHDRHVGMDAPDD
ncbi:MAG: hypothetical protein FJZ01_11775 [Candidatus Sericytochromatia bacterium]|nr:hypothetical protein [Candidatus Tanganyikabacteria bacterium]